MSWCASPVAVAPCRHHQVSAHAEIGEDAALRRLGYYGFVGGEQIPVIADPSQNTTATRPNTVRRPYAPLHPLAGEGGRGEGAPGSRTRRSSMSAVALPL